MARFHTKSGLSVMLLALGFLMLSARPAQAALRDNRLGIFVDFPGKGASVVGFIPGSPSARVPPRAQGPPTRAGPVTPVPLASRHLRVGPAGRAGPVKPVPLGSRHLRVGPVSRAGPVKPVPLGSRHLLRGARQPDVETRT